MGGNALQTPSRRIPRSEYFSLLERVQVALLNAHSTDRLRAIPAYYEKADFGDMDLLVVWHPSVDPRTVIEQAFAPAEIVCNAGVYSFAVDGFQVDLVGVSPLPGRFEAALHYFSWNDLGNLMGRIAHKLGFKYGHQGLLLPVRDDQGHPIEEVEVSLQTTPILEFLGYDAQGFFAGFDTLEDIFRYAASSRFFDPSIFAFENLNHINRTRNRKRASYMAFVQWLEDQPVMAAQMDHVRQIEAGWTEEEKEDDRRRRRRAGVLRAYEFFGREELQAKIDGVQARLARREAVRAKFNGSLVREIHPHLQGEALGRFIADFKKAYGTELNPPRDEWFENWVLRVSPEEIRTAILMFGAESAAAPVESSSTTP